MSLTIGSNYVVKDYIYCLYHSTIVLLTNTFECCFCMHKARYFMHFDIESIKYRYTVVLILDYFINQYNFLASSAFLPKVPRFSLMKLLSTNAYLILTNTISLSTASMLDITVRGQKFRGFDFLRDK